MKINVVTSTSICTLQKIIIKVWWKSIQKLVSIKENFSMNFSLNEHQKQKQKESKTLVSLSQFISLSLSQTEPLYSIICVDIIFVHATSWGLYIHIFSCSFVDTNSFCMCGVLRASQSRKCKKKNKLHSTLDSFSTCQLTE